MRRPWDRLIFIEGIPMLVSRHHPTAWSRHQMETFLPYWQFVWGIQWPPVNSPHKGQWRRALMLSLICVWMNSWVNSRDADDLRRHRAHYDVTVMESRNCEELSNQQCACCWPPCTFAGTVMAMYGSHIYPGLAFEMLINSFVSYE